MQEILEKVMELIIEIKDSVEIIEEKYSKLNFEFLIESINVSMREIPTNFRMKMNDNAKDSDVYNKIVLSLADVCKKSNIDPDKFVAKSLKIVSEEVSVNDLCIRCKGVLPREMKISEIYSGLKTLGERISVSHFTEEIKKHIKNEKIYSLSVSNIQQNHLNSKVQNFIKEMMSKTQGDKTLELTALVNQVKTSIVDEALRNKDFSNFYKFTRNLEITFNNPEHKVYLMEIFRQMILIERVSLLPKNEKITRIRQIQQGLLSVNIGELCLKYLATGFDVSLISKSLKLLHQLLDDCEVSIKEYILSDIKRLRASLQMFSLIRQVFHSTLDKLLTKSFEIDSTIELCFDVLLLLKLLTNGCYSPFQLYLLEQIDVDQRVSIDIVSELTKFVHNLVGIPEIKNPSIAPHLVQRILIKSFKVLACFCQGPCERNQIDISNNRQIYVLIN